MYGKELILDLHGCDPSLFTRSAIKAFLKSLCDLIEMERCDLHFWDYEDAKEKEGAPPHLAGTSVVQFIKTSNITIHTLDKLCAVYLNIFSCKEFDPQKVVMFAYSFFKAKSHLQTLVERTSA